MSNPETPGDTSPEGAAEPRHLPIEPSPSAEPNLESAAPTAAPSAAPPDEPAKSFDDPFGTDEPTAKIEAPPVERSFDDMPLPAPLRQAVRDMGWDKPTPVQASTFKPIAEGKDVLVQSQTGTGKTGAFCLPWLAARFEEGPAAQTGVQLIALTPTRELAKQVCDELLRLAKHTEVIPLPVYGGTAMQPQLAALKAGVHAVVGTPGRVLDHIRRRSLDLSHVKMVVLDEADEMLSMGFLEDIHSILDACTSENRQTTLFSATVPSEIERIARRYMRSPVSLRLSGDDIAAAEILHTYYSVTSSLKSRDLLDVIAIEEPATALVFCNTREEVGVVSSVLQREGFSAEPLSSDLTQTARERVLGWMRGGKLRFLVATDVASRGIDISHVTHVINYSFPENAESYVHRTGRTGRAGRAGQAISLISPQEIGRFYYLKLQYPSITFEERSLPPGDELQAQRTELKLDQVSKMFPELVSPEWTLLARNLMKDPRGERVIAYLLNQAMSARPRKQSMLEEEFGDEAKLETERPREGGWGDRGDRGRGPGRDRDRGGRGGRDRGPRDGARTDGPRGEARHDAPRDDARQETPRSEAREDRPRGDGRREDRPRGDGRWSEGRHGDRPRSDRDRSPRTDEIAARPTVFDGGAMDGEANEIREASLFPSLGAGEATEGARETEAARIDAPRTDDRDRDRRGGRGRGRGRGRDRDDRPRDASADDRPPRRSFEESAPAPSSVESATASGEVVPLADHDEVAFDPFAEPASTVVADDAPAITTEGGAVTITGDTDDGGRRRRRRRRRRRGGGQAEGTADESRESAGEAPRGDTETDDEDDDVSSEASPTTNLEADTEEGRSRRRRRRRGRRRGGGADAPPAVTPQVVVAPEQPIPQDEILIDIDESELEIVRDAFGEIDELDDFTLKGRRRGVLDTLAEEVELEDLTAKDQVPAAPAAEDSATDGEIDGDAEGEDDDGGPEAGESLTEGVIEADGDAASDDPNKRKRKRRRRRKKKSEAEPPPPALMAPPHKDFWEVWASHFSYTDFEEANPEPEPEPEPEPVRARPRERGRDRGDRPDRGARGQDRGSDRGSDRSHDREPARDRPFAEHAFEDSRDSGDNDDLVTVRLNLGRSHDKKAANIRDLLAEKAGVAGRKVKNLTVGDRDTEFQIGRSLFDKLVSSLGGVACDGVVLAIDLVDSGVDESEDLATDGDGADVEVPPSEPVVLADEPSDTAPVT